jgi:NADH-quinone oxidoreductase subunit A
MAFEWMFQIGLYATGVLIVIGVMLGLPALLGERHWKKPERRRDIATDVPYESGIRPTGNARIRFPIQYYLVAMLFVIFDVEAVFLYAWAVTAKETGWPGFIEAAIFATILLAALAYLWRVGALDWSAQFQRPPMHRLRDRQARDLQAQGRQATERRDARVA